MSLIVPRFSYHAKTKAMLTEECWHEIFDPLTGDAGKNQWSGYRKIAKVRIAQCNSLYISHGDLKGVYIPPGTKQYYRRMYGVVLLRTQHDLDQKVEYGNKLQLWVSHTMTFKSMFSNVTIYMTPQTRLTERTYYIDGDDIALGALFPVKDEDYEYGLLKTQKMVEWVLHPPPLKFKE